MSAHTCKDMYSLGLFLVNTNKGKAYIDYETQEEADKAIAYMDNVKNKEKRKKDVIDIYLF